MTLNFSIEILNRINVWYVIDNDSILVGEYKVKTSL